MIRVYRDRIVTASLKKSQFTLQSALAGLAIIALCGAAMLAVITSNVMVDSAVVEHTKFEYKVEAYCLFGSPQSYVIYVLYGYEVVLVLAGLYLCWKIRKVQSTLCNVDSILQGKLEYCP